MKRSNLKEVRQSFSIQACGFENISNFTDESYMEHIRCCISPSKADSILEVASGTCLCGRSLAPYVKTAVCLDATPAMLVKGKAEAEKRSLDNMVFIKGLAEDLPFLDNSFDIVISRLAFHHFPDPETSFREMARVLKPSGKLVLIDMEATDEALRTERDSLEKMRDISHERMLSRIEMETMFLSCGLTIASEESADRSQRLSAWLDLTKTDDKTKDFITQKMIEEMQGGSKTGFFPYMKDDAIWFDQHWILLIGRK